MIKHLCFLLSSHSILPGSQKMTQGKKLHKWLADFKPMGTGYESIYYGIIYTRLTMMARSSTWSVTKSSSLEFIKPMPQTDLNFWLSLFVKQHQKPCSGSPPVYQDLSMCHNWSLRIAIVDLPIRLQTNLKHISGNLLRQLGARNKDVVAALQTVLTRVRLCQCDAGYCLSG